MIVVADTTPLNYLVLIQHEDLLPRLFGRVLIPPAVSAELLARMQRGEWRSPQKACRNRHDVSFRPISNRHRDPPTFPGTTPFPAL